MRVPNLTKNVPFAVASMIDDTAGATPADILLQQRMHIGFLGKFTASCEVESRQLTYRISSCME